MSNDPSPWAEKPYDPPVLDSTEEMIRQAQEQAFEEDRERALNNHLWEKLANRMAADGTLIR